MDIRLIAMDLDGTALQKDRNSFSPRLLRALEEARRESRDPNTGDPWDLGDKDMEGSMDNMVKNRGLGVR